MFHLNQCQQNPKIIAIGDEPIAYLYIRIYGLSEQLKEQILNSIK